MQREPHGRETFVAPELSLHRAMRISEFKITAAQKYKWTVTALCDIHHSRSMRNCINISTTSWPSMSVAKVPHLRDHSRYNPGCAFSLRLSRATIGQRPEGNLDRLGVSRF